jgi:hypothetical protein
VELSYVARQAAREIIMGKYREMSRCARKRSGPWARPGVNDQRRSRGQSLVEFALILPVFIILIFGVVEYALINASIGAFNFAAQDAARYGAIIGPTDPNIDIEMLTQAITPRVSGIVMARLVSVEIFHASETGGCSDGTQVFPCPQEDLYTAQTGLWSYGWPVSSRNDQLITADYLGVRITYQYTYLTAFFATLSPQITLTAISVQRIEPQEYGKRPTSAPVVARTSALPPGL